VTRSNVRESLSAVEQALSHLARSLEQGGFGAGAAVYGKMSEVVIGQAQWVKEQRIDEFNERFAHIGALAGEIHDHLAPYVEAMRRLRPLAELVRPDDIVDPLSLPGRVLAALAHSETALSVTRLRSVVREPHSRVREAVTELVDQGLVVRRGTHARPTFAAGSALRA